MSKGDNNSESVQARLGGLRDEIDSLDERIVALLDRRARCSQDVGRIKSGSRDMVFKPFRERDVLERLAHRDGAVLPEEHLRTIYREIFSSSRRLQRPQQVAYLGPEGTFSYFAGVEFLGHSVDFVPQPGLEDVFAAVHSGASELGIIPLENSLQGTVGQSLDLFLRFPVFIQSELFCRISHCVLGRPRSLAEVRVVYSHPQPLAQCGSWLRNNLPSVKVIPTESTAAAAARVADEPDAVALGHHGLAGIFNLNVLASGVEDQSDNWTRFVVIGRAPAGEGALDKTSLLFTLPDKPGSLAGVLNVMARRGINMKKLESRPLRGEKWQYVFFVDVECDLSAGDYSEAFAELTENCRTMRILGSYPAGPSIDVSGARAGRDDPDAGQSN